MYKIDLLKGQGIPIKNRRGGILLVLTAFFVPLVVAGILFGFYVKGMAKSLVLDGSINDLHKKIARLAPAVESKKQMEARCAAMESCMADIGAHMNANECWSDILRTVVENVPMGMLVSKIDVRMSSIAKPEVVKAGTGNVKNVEYIGRTLEISLIGDPRKSGIDAVRQFVAALDGSPRLSPRMDDVRIMGQEEQTQEQVDRMRYDIECVFKSQKK